MPSSVERPQLSDQAFQIRSLDKDPILTNLTAVTHRHPCSLQSFRRLSFCHGRWFRSRGILPEGISQLESPFRWNRPSLLTICRVGIGPKRSGQQCVERCVATPYYSEIPVSKMDFVTGRNRDGGQALACWPEQLLSLSLQRWIIAQ